MMERIPEPELMDDAEQAEAYALADFSEANRDFVERFRTEFPSLTGGRVIDLGCGPADILIRLAQALPAVRLTGVDGAPAMLEEGRLAVARAGLGDQIELHTRFLPDLPGAHYDAVVSNSVLHHLHEPSVLWDAVRRAGRPGAPVLVVDLFRPESKDAARAMVEEICADARPVLKEDFYNSLLAAFTPDEVRKQLDMAGLGGLSVSTVSARHLAVYGRLPSVNPTYR